MSPVEIPLKHKYTVTSNGTYRSNHNDSGHSKQKKGTGRTTAYVSTHVMLLNHKMKISMVEYSR